MRQQNEDEVGPSYNPSEIEDLVKEIKSWRGLNEKTSEWQRGPFYPRYQWTEKWNCWSNKQTEQFSR